jgi:hypothetical protein
MRELLRELRDFVVQFTEQPFAQALNLGLQRRGHLHGLLQLHERLVMLMLLEFLHTLRQSAQAAHTAHNKQQAKSNKQIDYRLICSLAVLQGYCPCAAQASAQMRQLIFLLQQLRVVGVIHFLGIFLDLLYGCLSALLRQLRQAGPHPQRPESQDQRAQRSRSLACLRLFEVFEKGVQKKDFCSARTRFFFIFFSSLQSFFFRNTWQQSKGNAGWRRGRPQCARLRGGYRETTCAGADGP